MVVQDFGQVEQPNVRHWLLRFRSSHGLILATVCVAIFNDVFLFGTLIPVLPFALPHRIKIENDDIQMWIAILLAAYGGALLIGSLLFGWVGDRLRTRHGIFVFGLAMLLAATVVLSFSRTGPVMILGRLLQGLSAAVTWTSGLALLRDIFGDDRFGEAVGYAQTAVSVGTTSAPLLGGLVYSKGGFFAVSAMSIGTVAFSIVLAILMVEPASEAMKSQYNVDQSGNATAEADVRINGYKKLERGSTEVEDPGEDSHVPDEQTPLMSKAKSNKKLSTRPAYHLLLRSPRILAAMAGIVTYAFVMINLEGMVPLFVKETFHWDSFRTALIFLAWIFPGFTGPIAGKVSDRVGKRWLGLGGLLFAIPPLLLLRLVKHDSTGHKVLLCVLLTLIGFGLVWMLPACVSDLSAAATDLQRDNPEGFGSLNASGQAFGLFVFSYSCGSFVGPTVAGVIKAKASWTAATTTLAVACALACVPIMLKMPANRRRRQCN